VTCCAKTADSSFAPLSSRWLAAFLGILILGLDFTTKYLTQRFIPLSYLFSHSYPYGGIGVFKDFLGIEFSINYATNKGAAWGMLSDFQPYLLALRIVLVLSLLVYVIFFNTDWRRRLPLVLIIAGAFGNILDYFIYGHVIDMFHFILWGYDYPIFNIADSSIFIGIIWLFFFSSKSQPSPKKS
jgi:signal peptidase II